MNSLTSIVSEVLETAGTSRPKRQSKVKLLCLVHWLEEKKTSVMDLEKCVPDPTLQKEGTTTSCYWTKTKSYKARILKISGMD